MQLIKDQKSKLVWENIQPRKSGILEWRLSSTTLCKSWFLQYKILLLNCLTCVHLNSTKSEKLPGRQGPHLITMGQLQVYLNSNDLRADIHKILFHQSSRIQLLRCCTHCPELTDILCLTWDHVDTDSDQQSHWITSPWFSPLLLRLMGLHLAYADNPGLSL